jgi:hypothetical protein
MKLVTLQITMNVPNNCSLDDEDNIQQLLIDFPHKSVFINGEIISIR